MKLTVLGSGVCASQLPDIESRYPPGFLVTWGENEEHKILFECIGLDSDEAMIEDCIRSGFKGELVIAKDFQVLEV